MSSRTLDQSNALYVQVVGKFPCVHIPSKHHSRKDALYTSNTVYNSLISKHALYVYLHPLTISAAVLPTKQQPCNWFPFLQSEVTGFQLMSSVWFYSSYKNSGSRVPLYQLRSASCPARTVFFTPPSRFSQPAACKYVRSQRTIGIALRFSRLHVNSVQYIASSFSSAGVLKAGTVCDLPQRTERRCLLPLKHFPSHLTNLQVYLQLCQRQTTKEHRERPVNYTR